MRFKYGTPMLCSLALSVVTGIAQAALPAGYTVTEVNAVSGTQSQATGINDAGHVVGYLRYPEGEYPWELDYRAFSYNGSLTQIAPLAGNTLSSAAAINNAGVVVGSSTDSSPRGTTAKGFIYDGSTSAYGNPNYYRTEASDINNGGQIVGSFHADTWSFPQRPHAFLYDKGTMTDLGTLGGSFSLAQQINDKGQVVGRSYLAGDNATRGFIYENGAMTALGTLGGTDSWADGINNLGHIVGTSEIAGDRNTHAFLYADGVMTDLGTIGWLAQTSNSYALSINDRGDVLGYADGNGGRKYWLYSNGDVLDLNAMLGLDTDWTINDIAAINNKGQIAVTAQRGNYISQALRLDPVSAVPEPATYAMLGAGLLLIGARRKADQGKRAG